MVRKFAQLGEIFARTLLYHPSYRNGLLLCEEICKQVVDRSQCQLVDLSIAGFGNRELLLLLRFNPSYRNGLLLCKEICKQVVDRSQGQLVDLSITGFGNRELLRYISDRSSQLKRLEVIYCLGGMIGGWGVSIKKFPLLEELSIETTDIGPEDIEDVGRYCPLLKTFKRNKQFPGFFKKGEDDIVNKMAITIAKNLPNLRHLQLIGDSMSNIGLQAILDGCTHLESLDIRQCMYIDLKKDDIGKRCSERIKDVKLPNDSMEGGYMHLVGNYDKEPSDVSCESFDDSQYDDDDSDGNMTDSDFADWNDPTQEWNDYVNMYLVPKSYSLR